uniref:EB domain-containing protein n=1 Tax=Romanomermis culicivorax TaxID=13658 RepID=A0A915L7F5_ROMCU
MINAASSQSGEGHTVENVPLKAHWGDPCKEDGQCEGGLTMQCRNNRCDCLSGFNQILLPSKHFIIL